jgi:hypothetical protein
LITDNEVIKFTSKKCVPQKFEHPTCTAERLSKLSKKKLTNPPSFEASPLNPHGAFSQISSSPSPRFVHRRNVFKDNPKLLHSIREAVSEFWKEDTSKEEPILGGVSRSVGTSEHLCRLLRDFQMKNLPPYGTVLGLKALKVSNLQVFFHSQFIFIHFIFN